MLGSKLHVHQALPAGHAFAPGQDGSPPSAQQGFFLSESSFDRDHDARINADDLATDLEHYVPPHYSGLLGLDWEGKMMDVLISGRPDETHAAVNEYLELIQMVKAARPQAKVFAYCPPLKAPAGAPPVVAADLDRLLAASDVLTLNIYRTGDHPDHTTQVAGWVEELRTAARRVAHNQDDEAAEEDGSDAAAQIVGGGKPAVVIVCGQYPEYADASVREKDVPDELLHADATAAIRAGADAILWWGSRPPAHRNLARQLQVLNAAVNDRPIPPRNPLDPEGPLTGYLGASQITLDHQNDVIIRNVSSAGPELFGILINNQAMAKRIVIDRYTVRDCLACGMYFGEIEDCRITNTNIHLAPNATQYGIRIAHGKRLWLDMDVDTSAARKNEIWLIDGEHVYITGRYTGGGIRFGARPTDLPGDWDANLRNVVIENAEIVQTRNNDMMEAIGLYDGCRDFTLRNLKITAPTDRWLYISPARTGNIRWENITVNGVKLPDGGLGAWEGVRLLPEHDTIEAAIARGCGPQ